MHLVAVSDVFGRTICLEHLLSGLAENYESIVLLDPYEGITLDFKNEKEAYSHFQESIGLDGYLEKLCTYLKDKQHLEQHLIGFSVGASAIWSVSEKLGVCRT